jgi:hypothetical protein
MRIPSELLDGHAVRRGSAQPSAARCAFAPTPDASHFGHPMLRTGARQMRFLAMVLMLDVGLSAATLLLVRSFAALPSEASLEHLYTHVLSIQEVRRAKSGKFLMIEFEDLGVVSYSDEWSKYAELKASLRPGQEVDIWFDPHWSEYDPVYRIETASHSVLLPRKCART